MNDASRNDMANDESYPIDEPERSLGELVGDLTSELSRLVTAHFALAKAELAEDARSAARASAMLAAGAIAALLALAMLSAAVGWGLAETMAPGWAFLIVGAVWAVAAGLLVVTGRRRVGEMERTLDETRHEIKEDQRWLTTPTN